MKKEPLDAGPRVLFLKVSYFFNLLSNHLYRESYTLLLRRSESSLEALILRNILNGYFAVQM